MMLNPFSIRFSRQNIFPMVRHLMQRPPRDPMLGKAFFELEKSFQWVLDGGWGMEIRLEFLKIGGYLSKGVEKLYPRVGTFIGMLMSHLSLIMIWLPGIAKLLMPLSSPSKHVK